jgi:peroxiredoxin
MIKLRARACSRMAGGLYPTGLSYPITIDNDHPMWRALGNQYWRAHYIIDARGQVRYSRFGEGSCDTQEQAMQQLLNEACAKG